MPRHLHVLRAPAQPRIVRRQLLDTKETVDNNTCRIFLGATDGAVYQIACSQQYLDFMTHSERTNRYTMYNLCFVPTNVAERNSTGVNGHLDRLSVRHYVNRASYLRLANMTGWGEGL